MAEGTEELERRVAELEARTREAGRRLLFAAHGALGLGEASDGAALRHDLRAILEDAGRALLFDSETPDRAA